MNEEILHVLMIEDLPMAQKTAEKSFTELNCELDVVAWAAKAFEKLTKKKYDIIFADIHLPDINGLDLVQAIRSCDFEQEKVPIIAVTSSPSEELKIKATRCGCDDFISKPLNVEAVKKLLNKHLYRKKISEKVHEKT